MEYIGLDAAKRHGRGFWLRESKIYEVSSSSHFEFIVDHPEFFDMTSERVRAICNWQREPLGYEARAKEILIKHAVSLGWIKIRRYLEPSDYWLVQTDNTLQRSGQIRNFVLWAVDRENCEASLGGDHRRIQQSL